MSNGLSPEVYLRDIFRIVTAWLLQIRACVKFHENWFRIDWEICEIYSPRLMWFWLLYSVYTIHWRGTQHTQNICITCMQRRPNVFDVGPTLYKCYINILCLLGKDAWCWEKTSFSASNEFLLKQLALFPFYSDHEGLNDWVRRHRGFKPLTVAWCNVRQCHGIATLSMHLLYC